MLCADNLILMRETIEGLRNKFRKCNDAFESMDLKVSFVKTIVMVSGALQ